MRTAKWLVLGVIIGFIAASTASGSTVILNSTVTILSSSTDPYTGAGGFPLADALDVLTDGTPNYATDYASNSAGTTTHLDFKFYNPVIFDSIRYTDRTSSGGNNGSLLFGLFDFVTAYRYSFSNDPTFANIVATIDVSQITLPNCAGSCTLANIGQFQTTASVTGIGPIQYVRWQVLSINTTSPNPGASDFRFSGIEVPEPAGMALLGLGCLGLLAYKRFRPAQ